MTMGDPVIKITDELPHKPGSASNGASVCLDAGGVYHTRSLARSSRSYSRSPYPSARRPLAQGHSDGTESAGDVEDGGDWRRDDHKKKQVFKGTTLLWLAYQSIGTIYGDIGTSPLYVFSSTFSKAPEKSELVQVLSVILWSITIMVTLKYVLIVLHADNEGEGGTFSCYSLLARYMYITERDPREEVLVRMERHATQDLRRSNQALRSRLEKSMFVRGLLKVIGVLAVSMVIADGVLTPAQSVLGAVQGLKVVSPDITSPTIVGTSCGILILLFLVQPLGITKLASTFAPIVIIWLGFNASFGIYNLVMFDHSVLKAFSPYYALHFFMERKHEAWHMLGGILLAFTGVEALYADLGAFSMRAIQISWMGWCYPCLLLAYTGQAAYISVHPQAYENPFYNCVPPGMLYPSLVIAVLAAIVASQAMITAVFQLISQMMKLSYSPQVKVVHTSKKFFGQLFVPLFNWTLMCGTILVTAVYSNTTRLGNAYGVCVMFVTFFDTCMVTLCAIFVWRLPPYLLLLPWLFFATVDGLYLSSALEKVPEGAWFTIMLAGIMASFFLLWRFGKESQWRAEAKDRLHASDLVVATDVKRGTGKHNGSDGQSLLSQPGLSLASRWGGEGLSNIHGLGIFFDKTGIRAPTVFAQFVTKFAAIPEVTVFFHLHPVEVPTVPDDERYVVSRLGSLPGCYRLIIRHGFMDEVISPDLGRLVYQQIRKFIICRAPEAVHIKKADDIRMEDGRDDDEELDRNAGEKAVAQSEDAQGRKKTIVIDPSLPGAGDTTENASTRLGGEQDSSIQERELIRLEAAFTSKVMYLVGKQQMKISRETSLPRRLLLGVFLFIRDNTRAKIANLRLSVDRIVEVGFVKEI